VTSQPLVVQRRSSGHISWSTVATVKSASAGVYTTAGSYSIRLKPKASAFYRVTWSGVVTSRTIYVAAK
jgi:hypothetical protein